MSKFNFHQSVTEINKNGFVVHRLTQMLVAKDSFEWECEICNEEGVNLVERGAMALDALANAINAMHAVMLSEPVEDDDCSDLV